MWNHSRSLTLSLFCTRLFLGLLGVVLCTAPFLVNWYLGMRPAMRPVHIPIVATVYLCCIPAAILLFSLHRLLRRIRAGKVFTEENIRLLRMISWCCFAAGMITLTSGFFYLPFLLVAIACSFFGLILRVIKNIFEQALEIKQENDFTI